MANLPATISLLKELSFSPGDGFYKHCPPIGAKPTKTFRTSTGPTSA